MTIILTLIVAGVTGQFPVTAMSYELGLATYTDTQLHLCRGNVSFSYSGAGPVGGIGADGCKPDRVFANGFEAEGR